MSIVLTKEQKDADMLKRKEEFETGFKELQERTQFNLVAKISPDGPVNMLINTKEYA